VKAFQEARLEIVFDDTWLCEKWDEHPSFTRSAGKLQGTCAVDLLGIHGNIVYLIEIKDFRSHRIENKSRQTRDLPHEIATKVRDTIAGIIGASIMNKENPFFRECAAILGNTADERRIRVVAWILEDKVMPRKGHMHAAVRRKQLQAQLRWLTTKVFESDPLKDPLLDGVTVHNTIRP
jgi:hypothetical protein